MRPGRSGADANWERCEKLWQTIDMPSGGGVRCEGLSRLVLDPTNLRFNIRIGMYGGCTWLLEDSELKLTRSVYKTFRQNSVFVRG